MSTVTVTERDFETDYDGERTFPFFEDENCYAIFGYGHTDRAEFAAAVNDYDVYCGNQSEGYSERDVVHTYFDAAPHEGGWKLVAVAEPTSRSIAATVLAR